MPERYSKNDHEVSRCVFAGTCSLHILLLIEKSAAGLYFSVVLHSWRSYDVDSNLTFGTSRESSLLLIICIDLLRSNADAGSDKTTVQNGFGDLGCKIRLRRDHI